MNIPQNKQMDSTNEEHHQKDSEVKSTQIVQEYHEDSQLIDAIKEKTQDNQIKTNEEPFEIEITTTFTHKIRRKSVTKSPSQA